MKLLPDNLSGIFSRTVKSVQSTAGSLFNPAPRTAKPPIKNAIPQKSDKQATKAAEKAARNAEKAAKQAKLDAAKTLAQNGKKASAKAAIESTNKQAKKSSPIKGGGNSPIEPIDGLLVKVEREEQDLIENIPDLKDILSKDLPAETPAQPKPETEKPAKVTIKLSEANDKLESSTADSEIAEPRVIVKQMETVKPADAPPATDVNQPTPITPAISAPAPSTTPVAPAKPVETPKSAVEAKTAESASLFKEEKKTDTPGENKGGMFDSLFGKVEEKEETAMDRMIKSMPNIAIEEILSEAEEVKVLIAEYLQEQAMGSTSTE